MCRNVMVALHLNSPFDPDFGFGDGKPGTFVNDAGFDLQQFAGADEAAHLGFLDRAEKRHPFEIHQRDQQPAGGLRHRLDQQHAGHDRIAREMSLEDGAMGRNLRFNRNGALVEFEVDDAVNQLEIFETA